MLSLTKLTTLLSCSLIMVVGCATTQKLTPMEQRQLTTRVIDAPYENVFRATLAVLQGEGYNIKNRNMETGRIIGDVEKKQSPGLKVGATVADILTNFGADKTETTIVDGWDYHVNCLITAVSDSSAEVHVTMEKVTHGTKTTTTNDDSYQVEVKQGPEIVYDEKVFRNLFDKIKVEVMRRQTMQQ